MCIQHTKVPLPATYTAVSSSTDAALSAQPWANVFQDPALQTLIRAAIDSNTNLQIAAVRVACKFLESRLEHGRNV